MKNINYATTKVCKRGDFFGTRAAEVLLVLFFGGTVYCSAEMLWRGRTHISMALCGALCFFVLYRLEELPRFRSLPLAVRAAAGAAVINSSRICDRVRGKSLARARRVGLLGRSVFVSRADMSAVFGAVVPPLPCGVPRVRRSAALRVRQAVERSFFTLLRHNILCNSFFAER